MPPLKIRNLSIDVAPVAFLKIFLFALALFVLFKISAMLTLLFFSVLLAVAFEPVIKALERTVSRRTAVVLIALLLSILLGVFIFLIVPPLLEQTNRVIEKIPSFIKTILADTHPRSLVHRIGKKVLGSSTVPDLSTSFSQIVVVGQLAVGSISSLGLFFAFTIYLMLDGQKTFQWFLPFFSISSRAKIEETLIEVSSMISAYVLGQGIASLACGIYVFGLLTLLNVPAALMLAVIAAVFAVLPIIGFYISLIPILIFALLVSPTTAILSLLFLGFYHLFEGYYLLPVIYSQKLKLSGFVVLIAIVFGMSLMGVLGAIALLPIAASYPVIERIWLSKYLRDDVISTHEHLNEKNPTT